MSSCSSCIFLFLFSFLTSYGASAENPFYLDLFCPNTTRSSTYFTNNREAVLSSLRNAAYSTEFQNATAGQAPDKVYGLFLCRGDMTPEVCLNCVTYAVNQILARCPNGNEAVIYYEECILRYSHKNIFSVLTLEGGHIRMNGYNISLNQEVRFREQVASMLNRAASEAANSPRKFYTTQANFSTVQTLYVLAQCTPDLTISEKPKPTPQTHQVWKPKITVKQNDVAAPVSAPSRTCIQDKEDIKAPNVKGLKAAFDKANTSSQTAHVIARANRFQALCDELAETS